MQCLVAIAWAAAWLVPAMPLAAAEIQVPPGADSLAQAVAAAAPRDVLRLASGLYDGPIVIDKPLTVEGVPGTVVDGGGHGTVIRITAPEVVIRGLTVRHSGTRQEDIDSGIFADKGADRALIERNHVEDNEFGISLRGAKGAVARDNTIRGLQVLRVNERGDGISVWNATDSQALDNDVRFGRDGIRITASRGNVLSGNRFHELRYAIHYMWTDHGTISENLSEGNDVGFALMFSRHLSVTGNISRNDREHGLLFNFANNADVRANLVSGSDKCVFIYDANDNKFDRNWFEDCAIGIHFTAGSERNRFSENAFLNNHTQVMYVGTRSLDWASDGRGNYWSDNPAFDLDGDGIADMPYRPNDMVDRVVWAVPLAKMLLNSPAVQVVRWAQSEFPAVTPGGVIDTAPLMRPPPRPSLPDQEASR